MNDTEIKTRHGLILQGACAAALSEAGYSFEADFQYDPICERPDFLIPSAAKPEYMVEVHQTDVRNSLAMKTLRAFIAVAEAKASFGADLVSVNLIFGDPDEDFSSSPLSAIGAIYDVNVFPARDKSARKALEKLERDSLKLAGDDGYTTRQAIDVVCGKNGLSIATFAATINSALAGAKARAELNPLWLAEKKRRSTLGDMPSAGTPTYYKRLMLGSLFFTDGDFEELIKGAPAAEWPAHVVQQLTRVGLASVTEEMDGDHVQVDSKFLAFLRDPEASRLRGLCKEVLDSVPEMGWFFDDIRDEVRRAGMSGAFVNAIREGKTPFGDALMAHLEAQDCHGYEHQRGWFIDLCAIATDRSFNYYNKAIFRDSRYPLNLWNAFSNLAIRSPSLVKDPKRLKVLCEIVVDKVFQALEEEGRDASTLDEAVIARGLLKFRVTSAIKLRKLNPLVIVVASVAARYGLAVQRSSIDTLLYDLARDSGVGRFLVFKVSAPNTEKQVLMSVVAVHDGNGDHKSKEWGARRIASLYRYLDGKVKSSGFQEGLFVIDGEWEDKDVARLYRSGWNYICRLGDLEPTLKKIFDLKATRAIRTENGDIGRVMAVLDGCDNDC